MTDHPITPPPELVQQWLGDFFGCVVSGELSHSERFLATRAAQWGANKELEACCEYMKHEDFHGFAKELRAARRPKPPSLKEQALDAYSALRYGPDGDRNEVQDWNAIRRALEALTDD